MRFDELPDLLTVPEAAQFLRIGRSLGYELAQQWVATGGREGIPVVQLGHRLLVPKCQLARLLDAAPPPLSIVPAVPPTVLTSTRPPRRPRRTPTPPTQISLLDHDQPASA